MKRLAPGLLFIVSVFSSFGQDSTVVQDYETWSGLTLRKSFLEKKLNLALTQEFRFDDNSTHLDQYFTELGIEYKLRKGLSLGFGYRFIRNNKNSGYHNEQRIFADLEYAHKLDRFRLSYRFRFQNHDELGVSKDEGDDITQKYRLRIKVGYNIRNFKLTPYVSAEGFLANENRGLNYIETITKRVKYTGLEKLRYTVGLDYPIRKFFEIGAYYRIEQGLKSYPASCNTPTLFYIGGLNLTFKL